MEVTTEESQDPTLSLVTSTTPGDGRRRRQASKKTKGVEGLPPCLICGEPASGLHYGVNSCSACKAFFFRNWMRRDHLVCEGDGNCMSIPGSGLGCPACRMKRCLKAGMSLTGTRRGRYTHETRVKIKRDAKKMLGDDTIKASVTCSVKNSPSREYFTSSSPVENRSVSEPVSEMTEMDCESSQDKDLDKIISYFSPEKTREMTEDESKFYDDLSLQPLDLTKGDMSPGDATPVESSGMQNGNLDVPKNVNSSSTFNTSYADPTQNYFPNNFPDQELNPYQSQSFLSLMNTDSEPTMPKTTESQSINGAQLISHPSWYPSINNGQHTMGMQLMPFRMVSGTKDDEEDDYTKLQEVICTMLSTPKTAILKLKGIAESITGIYRKFDQYPEGFFDCVDDIQNKFVEQKALKRTVFGDMKPLSQEEYLKIYQSTGLDIDGRRTMVEKNTRRYEEWYQKYIKFAKNLPHFLDLPVQDQIAILKAAKTQFVVLCDYQAFDADKLMFTDNHGETYDVDDFSKVFSPLYITTMADFVRTLKALNLTEEERNVMKSICLFTPEYCVTEVGKERAHEQYVHLIHVLAYLLIENHGHDPTFQYRLLQAREISKIFSRMDDLEKMNAYSLYAEDSASVPLSLELFSPTQKAEDQPAQ